MGDSLDYVAPVLQHDNLIRILYCGQSVRYHQTRSTHPSHVQRLLNNLKEVEGQSESRPLRVTEIATQKHLSDMKLIGKVFVIFVQFDHLSKV